MVRVCADSSCKISARFNTPGEKRGMFCSKHRQPGMVDVIHARCAMNGCEVLASFNVEGCPRGVLCSVHKQARPARRPEADVGDLRVGGAGGARPLARRHTCASCNGQQRPGLGPGLAWSCGQNLLIRALFVTTRMCARAGGHGERQAPQLRASGLLHSPGF